MDLNLPQLELFERLGVALALGVLVGIERGWHERDLREGRRVAGIRTQHLGQQRPDTAQQADDSEGAVVLGFAFLAFAGVVIVTMVAAESFDPRLMWDRSESRNG